MRLNQIKNELWGQAWWLRSKFVSKSVRNQARAFLDENQDKMIFVMGSGRSGTQLISDLLDSTGMAKVFHEPNFWEDVSTMDTLRKDAAIAVRYWQEFRILEVYRRWMEKPEAQIYGEVNGTIRYQAPAIKKIFPNSKMLLVVRDGRAVVRSVMGWPQFYGPKSKGAYALSPLTDDPYLDEWPRMSRFEKICWSWNDTHEFLMRYISPIHWLQLERLTSDYDYFTEHFSRYINIEMPYDHWFARVSKKSRNSTKVYGFPEWKEWSGTQRKGFIRICGGTMSKLGYLI